MANIKAEINEIEIKKAIDNFSKIKIKVLETSFLDRLGN